MDYDNFDSSIQNHLTSNLPDNKTVDIRNYVLDPLTTIIKLAIWSSTKNLLDLIKKLPVNLELVMTPASTTGRTTDGYPGNNTANRVGFSEPIFVE